MRNSFKEIKWRSRGQLQLVNDKEKTDITMTSDPNPVPFPHCCNELGPRQGGSGLGLQGLLKQVHICTLTSVPVPYAALWENGL